jgi:hypothetical protein
MIQMSQVLEYAREASLDFGRPEREVATDRATKEW